MATLDPQGKKKKNKLNGMHTALTLSRAMQAEHGLPMALEPAQRQAVPRLLSGCLIWWEGDVRGSYMF